MRHFLSCFAAPLALLLLAAPACVDWEQQVVVIRHDAGADAIELRIVTRGIHAAPEMLESGLDVEEELADLRRLDRVFWLLDGMVKIDLDALAAEADPRSARLLSHLKVVDHGLFVDENGALSAWHDVRLSRAGAMLAWFNQMIDALVLEEPGEWDDLPDGVLVLNRAAARRGGDWVRLDAATGLSFGMHATAEAWTDWKREFLSDLLLDQPDPEGGEEQGDSKQVLIEFLSRNAVSLTQRGTEGRLWFGPAADGAVRLDTVRSPDATTELLEAVREDPQAYRLRQDITLAGLLER